MCADVSGFQHVRDRAGTWSRPHYTGGFGQSIQSSPNSSAGWGVRIVPLPHRRASAGQYRSQPQHTFSGRLGWSGGRGGVFAKDSFIASPCANSRPRRRVPTARPYLTISTPFIHRGSGRGACKCVPSRRGWRRDIRLDGFARSLFMNQCDCVGLPWALSATCPAASA